MVSEPLTRITGVPAVDSARVEWQAGKIPGIIKRKNLSFLMQFVYIRLKAFVQKATNSNMSKNIINIMYSACAKKDAPSKTCCLKAVRATLNVFRQSLASAPLDMAHPFSIVVHYQDSPTPSTKPKESGYVVSQPLD